MLLIWNFSFRHSLTATATEDLCKLVNCLLNNEFIPTTKYMFRQVFGSINYSFHFYCPDCNCYIKEILKSEKKKTNLLQCPVCNRKSSTENMNDGHFFVTLPVKHQLIFFLENTNEILELILYRWNRDKDDSVISDIFDRLMYKELIDNGTLSSRFSLSLSFSTDGAVIFSGSKNTLWPIHFRINELPPSCRFDQNNSMLAGLWFGRNEPDMPLLLSAFVKEAKVLYNDGLDWKAPSGELINSKIVLFAGVLDSKAKPIVQNIKQFNGYFGCGYCYHPGVVLEEGTHAKYPMNDDVYMMDDFSLSYTVNGIDRVSKEEKVFQVTDRNDEECRKEMELAESLRREGKLRPGGVNDYKGLKGKNAFWILSYFNLIFGFAIDYMHGVLLGVVKTMTFLWFESPAIQSFSLKDKEVIVDERLLNICPPSSISRRPRSITDRSHWKANEWRSWLLYYSLPCLIDILPMRYLKHHCLLISASYILLSENISNNDLQKATWFLVEYVLELMKLYGSSFMHFNTHLLLHMGKMVKLMGPWWCSSAFSFETGNGCLMKLVKGVRGTASQIAEKYSMCRILPNIIQSYNVKEDVLSYCLDLMCYRIVKEAYKVNSITVFGAHKYVPLSDEERQAFRDSEYEPISTTYERMIKDSIKYHAKCYARQGAKSNDSVVKLTSGKYAIIKRIVMLTDKHTHHKSVFILTCNLNIECNDVIVAHQYGAKALHIKVCSPLPYGEYKLYNANDIHAKSILMTVGNRTYVTDFPNRYEKD